jgi:hypothetical protein
MLTDELRDAADQLESADHEVVALQGMSFLLVELLRRAAVRINQLELGLIEKESEKRTFG